MEETQIQLTRFVLPPSKPRRVAEAMLAEDAASSGVSLSFVHPLMTSEEELWQNQHIYTRNSGILAQKSDGASVGKMQDTDFRRSSLVRSEGIWLWFPSHCCVSQELQNSCSELAATWIQKELKSERVQQKGFLVLRVLKLFLVVIVHLLDESSENENLK